MNEVQFLTKYVQLYQSVYEEKKLQGLLHVHPLLTSELFTAYHVTNHVDHVIVGTNIQVQQANFLFSGS
jgi:hypothetical protein